MKNLFEEKNYNPTDQYLNLHQGTKTKEFFNHEAMKSFQSPLY